MVTDPVCRMAIDERSATHWVVLKGHQYFFCSEGCLAEFLRHPDDYTVREGEEGRVGS
jgi:P-type Cu+ transporter